MGDELGQYDALRIERVLDIAVDRVVCVDPGDSTGVACFEDGSFVTYNFRYADFLQLLCRTNLLEPPITIICEQFITRPGRFAREQIAGKVCGVLDLFCALHDISLIYQSPSTVKTMIPRGHTLKHLGWVWNSEHEMDAIRHGIYYLVTRNK